MQHARPGVAEHRRLATAALKEAALRKRKLVERDVLLDRAEPDRSASGVQRREVRVGHAGHGHALDWEGSRLAVSQDPRLCAVAVRGSHEAGIDSSGGGFQTQWVKCVQRSRWKMRAIANSCIAECSRPKRYAGSHG